VLAVTALTLALVAPRRPAAARLDAAGFSAQLVARQGDSAQFEAGAPRQPADTLSAQRTGPARHDGVAADVYTASLPGRADTAGLPSTATVAEVTRRNGGRLPLGAHVSGDRVPLHYTAQDTATFWIEPRPGRVVDLSWREVVTRTAVLSTGPLVLGTVRDHTQALPRADAVAAGDAARHAATTLDQRRTLTSLAAFAGTVGGALLLTAAVARSLPVSRPRRVPGRLCR
jgi:high-affinity iron transporter